MKLILPSVAVTVLSLSIAVAEEAPNGEMSALDKAADNLAGRFYKGVRSLAANDTDSVSLPQVGVALTKHGFGRFNPASDTKKKAAKSKTLSNPRYASFLKDLDPDKNGNVSREEVVGACKNILEDRVGSVMALDANKDGKLSAAEFALSRRPSEQEKDADGLTKVGRKQFASQDLNKDGFIDGGEALKVMQHFTGELVDLAQFTLRFKSLDTDGNGEFSAEELNKAIPGWVPEDKEISSNEIFGLMTKLTDEQKAELDSKL